MFNIGAGRIVYQGLTRISKAIDDRSFFKNEILLEGMRNCKNNNKKLHIMGLTSKGGVHSHLDHLFALLKLAKNENLNEVYIHCFTDGRDVGIMSADGDISELENKMKELKIGKIATIMGRYYAMDRDNRWDRIKRAYDAMIKGEGEKSNDLLHKIIKQRYEKGETDEFIKPIICDEKGLITEGDTIIFFNFRPDRARQITKAFVEKDFDKFDRKFLKPNFICMTQYDEKIKNVNVAFMPIKVKNGFAEYISKQGLKQLHIAETEKYAHVTFFFNGGKEEQYENEDRILIDSKKVATYDLAPEMSASEIADKTIEAINKEIYDVIILNFANCDMVGHTGNYQATIKAVEAVDKNVGRIEKKVKEKNGIMIITADHGNAEAMIKKEGEPMTAHTVNKVVFVVDGYDCKLRDGGKLGDIAPTILDIMGLQKPLEMTGNSLIKRD